MLKIPVKYEQGYFHNFLHPVPPVLLPDYRRSLVDESGVFPADFIPPWFCILMYHVGDEQ
jgi:hypothetical protein